MNRERFARLREVLARATELPKNERASYLKDACGEDEALRHEAEAILAREGNGPSLLGTDGEFSDATVDRSHSAESDMTQQLDPDRTLTCWGPLQLLEKIGEGGFGETFRAHDPNLERDVALKLLKPDASRREEIAGRVTREGVLLARVSHANVVTVYGAERHEGRVGLWMELVRGRTLEELLARDGPLGERETVLVGLDLCRALAAVHAAGIIHRDVKGTNVMREEGGRIVLMDFGASVDPRKDSAASLSGTPFYMAPELFEGEPATVPTDLYSLGVLLYRLLTGAFPVTGDSLPALKEAHSLGEARHLRDVRADLSGSIVEIVEKCLAQDPEERYETAGSLETALARALTGAGPEHRHTVAAPTFDFTAWRHGRIAEWSRPRYRLDTDFVALTLLIDQGEESASERWSARPERYRDLGELLAATDDLALVLLGPPGCGKSTLLRRLEMDVARAALVGSLDTVTFLVQLNHYRAPGRGELPVDPAEWLADRWRARFPELPPFHDLIAQGRMVLLLDALNEMPAPSQASLREAVAAWKEFLELLMEEHPGNRVVFSCRTLDYSAPLSTPRLRVPQVVVEPLTDEQVERFLVKNAAEQGAAVWKELAGTPQLEVMRSPYFLSLLLGQMEGAGGMPEGLAGLFTGFIRHALRREVERDNPVFAPDGLLTDRDVRRITQWRWKTPWELPERGALVPKISDLAFGMQDVSADGEASQVRIGFDAALELLDDERDEDIVRAGVALSVLDEDAAHDEVLFFHQLLQEYFAGRKLAVSPEPERVRVPWKAAEVVPPVGKVLDSLHGSELLPGLPTTGWEETTLLAAVMARDPDGFVRGLMETNLSLAGRCAGQAEVRGRLAPDLLEHLRDALLARSTEREADLRARIEAGLALGPLGDPRFRRRTGPHGDFLLPPMVEISGGRYPMGADEAVEWVDLTYRHHMPRHEVEIAPFALGRFPVTNAEWGLFQESGGYEKECWWDTEAARRWRIGEGTADAARWLQRYWLQKYREDPRMLEKAKERALSEKEHELFRERLSMTDEQLETHLKRLYPGGVLREPACWRDGAHNNGAQPVVGVSWFEAQAYTRWLSAQSGEEFRLPTEAEWEAAARGREGRPFAYGDEFDALKANHRETRLHKLTPVGVFPEGQTPEGVSDLTASVSQWTSTLFGSGLSGVDEPEFAYPYRAEDGREDLAAGAEVRRVLRGSSWKLDRLVSSTWVRLIHLPGDRSPTFGFRLACSVSSSGSG